MGDFRVTVEATGGHGCQRDIKDGQQVQEFCGIPGCPDCLARDFVAALKRAGHMIRSAVLTHWPGQPGEVNDDLVTMKRTGNF